MRIFLIITILFSLANAAEQTQEKPFDTFLNKHWDIGDKERKEIINGSILVDVEVEDYAKEKQQSFKMKAVGQHQIDCSRVLRKLSRFEKLHSWLNFVESSDYNDEKKLLTIKADHVLLPYPMVVNIFIKRPTAPGKYPFMFPTGIFTGLTGTLFIEEFEGRCTFFANSEWKGPDTGISNFAIDLFATTLTKLGAEMLIRKTRF